MTNEYQICFSLVQSGQRRESFCGHRSRMRKTQVSKTSLDESEQRNFLSHAVAYRWNNTKSIILSGYYQYLYIMKVRSTDVNELNS